MPSPIHSDNKNMSNSEKPKVRMAITLNRVSTLIDPNIDVVEQTKMAGVQVINNEIATGGDTRSLLNKVYGKRN